ncbi:MAG: acetyl-CoA carboxylase, biotin carboxyl carrier protein [candidate division Zixibacteria bacterium RBG_16_48_11]|nr:MAG: acetyl-CoA carboxylase, biotin carboxyl carrier protein [candidate division Zixibacteria bacterium RBG_16_48_11]
MLESKIRKLIRLLEESDNISEIEISSWGRKIRIRKNAENNHTNSHKNSAQELILAPIPSQPQVAVPQPQATIQPPSQPAVVVPALEIKLTAIKSPMVGTFYPAPAPGAKAYVEVGEEVRPGQVVCIVEAMKLMNEIESEVTGKIVKVCVENAQAVEFGQDLFLVEPA